MGTVPVVARDGSVESSVLAASIEAIRRRAQVEVVLGGPVSKDAAAMRITDYWGTRPRSSLPNLLVESGLGVGGKSLSLLRPTWVSDYFNAPGITHTYDHVIRPEAINTMAAIPVLVDRVPRVLVYLATRARVPLGDRWFDSLAPTFREISYNIQVEDEVRRRLAAVETGIALQEPHLDRRDLVDIASELNDLARQITDTSLRQRLEDVGQRLVLGPEKQEASAVPVSLRPSELEVLREVARGASNQDAADRLGLQPNTVKSYLKAAMGKLHAKNRVQAVLRAREIGLL